MDNNTITHVPAGAPATGDASALTVLPIVYTDTKNELVRMDGTAGAFALAVIGLAALACQIGHDLPRPILWVLLLDALPGLAVLFLGAMVLQARGTKNKRAEVGSWVHLSHTESDAAAHADYVAAAADDVLLKQSRTLALTSAAPKAKWLRRQNWAFKVTVAGLLPALAVAASWLL